MSSAGALLGVERVTRRYPGSGGAAGFVLAETTLTIAPGTWTALTGRSGSGKSTLLRILAGLDRPDSGSVHLFGEDVTRASEDRLARLRRERIGVVHQQFLFIDYLPVWRNVTARLVPAGVPARERRERARRALERFGLAAALDRRPLELSGGEQQRVALARALIDEPQVLIADEPTSNVDAQTGAEIVEHLQRLRSAGTTVIVSTHDPALIGPADQRWIASEGRIET